ncbi:MAG TPA: AAA family ATPase [Tenericutes bacterium]|nr:AAA family ATPase [Mycoplasmatota bacterium]
MEKEFSEEKKYLEQVIKRFDETIKEQHYRINNLSNIYKDDLYLLAEYIDINEKKLEVLNKTKEKPYFARIDFKANNENINKLYIGKVGVSDPDEKIITIDWRTPVATLYYDSNIGKCSYIAPEGEIYGELFLKRQYDIENKILKGFQDIDTVSNDEILKPYLGVSADNRLKNIVATIQTEQNEIIREPIFKNIIVQGVAGSGKTTVALHRIAYLVYNNINSFKPSQYMIIGPNKFFLNYISNVLPDLDVNNVCQNTYYELTKVFSNEDFNLINEETNLLNSIKTGNTLDYLKIKTSLEMKDAIDLYFKEYITKNEPSKDLIIKGYKILSSDIIKDIYNSVDDDFYYNVKSKIDRVILLISKYIADNVNFIIDKITKQFYKNSENSINKTKLIKDYENIKKEVNNGCKSELKKYFSKINYKALNIYSDFIKNIDNYSKFDNDKLKAETLKNIKKGMYEFEDLASILYIKYKLIGTNGYEKYIHIVIDEAQDFGEFNFFVLNKIMSKSTFSIFGDLAQSIYSYRSISSWDNILDKYSIKYLTKSYRTTIEIMNYANKITSYLNLNTATPVIRHGNKVVEIKSNNTLQNIKDILNKNSDYKSIAIICKDEFQVLELSKKLANEGILSKTITSSHENFDSGLFIITSHLVKGLEFDVVILIDVDEENYRSSNILDLKLLYVSITRALHNLYILYKNDLPNVLK